MSAPGHDTFIAPAPRRKKNTKGLSLVAESLAPPTLDDDAAEYDSSIASKLVPSRSLRLQTGGRVGGVRAEGEEVGSRVGGVGGGGIEGRLTLTKLPIRAAPPNPDESKRLSLRPQEGGKRADSKSPSSPHRNDHTKLSERMAGMDLSSSTGTVLQEDAGSSSHPSTSSDTSPTKTTHSRPTMTTRKKRDPNAPEGSSSLRGKTKKASTSTATTTGPAVSVEFRNEDFKPVRDLGAGNGGTVNLVEHVPSGLVMAKKLVLIDAKPTVRKQILRELQIMHDCSSPWIVSFYGAYLSDPHICICMEFADKGSLDAVYRKNGAIPINIVGKVAEAVLEGLTYLYDVHRIIHRDIKPSNILLNSEGDIKICDFGVSGELVNSIANTFVGTSTYMSPERIQGSNYSVKSDVWSLGVSLIELALGRFPFADDEHSDDDRALGNRTISSAEQVARQEARRQKAESSGGVSLEGGGSTMSILDLLQHIVNEPAPRLTPPGKFPSEAETFMEGCLAKDPKKRKSPKALLQSEWLVDIKSGSIDVKAWAATIT